MFSIQTEINNYITSGREKRSVTSWQASKLGSCLTGVYLERIGVEPDEEFDERTLRVFSVGKMFEDWLVGILAKTGMKHRTQVRIEDKKLGVSGYADLVVDSGQEPIIYEVKSKHSKSFWYMDKKKEGASMHNKMQVWLYMYVLKIKESRLIYLSKDDLAILEYQVFLDDKELEKLVLGEIAILNRALQEKLPPPPPDDPKDWRASYCRWHKKCVSQKEYLQ